MSLLERVQQLLAERGLSIKQAERESGLSNATIRKWATQNPSFESIVKLANYLHVSIDYLAHGEVAPPQSRFEVYCDGQPLTGSEADIVAMYRLLPEDHREDVYEIVRSKYERLVEKKGSYYSACTEADEAQESGPVESREARDGTA